MRKRKKIGRRLERDRRIEGKDKSKRLNQGRLKKSK